MGTSDNSPMTSQSVHYLSELLSRVQQCYLAFVLKMTAERLFLVQLKSLTFFARVLLFRWLPHFVASGISWADYAISFKNEIIFKMRGLWVLNIPKQMMVSNEWASVSMECQSEIPKQGHITCLPGRDLVQRVAIYTTSGHSGQRLDLL